MLLALDLRNVMQAKSIIFDSKLIVFFGPYFFIFKERSQPSWFFGEKIISPSCYNSIKRLSFSRFANVLLVIIIIAMLPLVTMTYKVDAGMQND
jgi:hypothetical protein